MKKWLGLLLAVVILIVSPVAGALTQDDFDTAVAERDALYNQLVEAGIEPCIGVTDFSAVSSTAEEDWWYLLSEAFEAKDVTAYVSSVRKGAPEEIAYNIITDACKEFDYDAFLFMDSILKKLPAGELKNNLQTFAADNGKTRTKAFLKGTWELKEASELPTQIEVFVDEDDAKCTAIITQVGTVFSWYLYTKGELYWWNFIFENDTLTGLSNRTRNQYGYPNEYVAEIFVYENANSLALNLYPGSDINMSNSKRTWVRITSD